jgi:hypothetical protein
MLFSKMPETLQITARQYGEVVFPLFATKSGMAHFLPSLPSEALAKEAAKAGTQVQRTLQNCLESSSKS